MVPGGDRWYLAGNGRLNQVRPGDAAPGQQGARPHPAVYQPHVPPPHVQPQGEVAAAAAAVPGHGQQQNIA